MEDRRIYSINLASYLSSKDYKYKIGKDEDKENLYYFVFAEDLTELIEEYKANYILQNFIRSYRDIKKNLRTVK